MMVKVKGVMIWVKCVMVRVNRVVVWLKCLMVKVNGVMWIKCEGEWSDGVGKVCTCEGKWCG